MWEAQCLGRRPGPVVDSPSNSRHEPLFPTLHVGKNSPGSRLSVHCELALPSKDGVRLRAAAAAHPKAFTSERKSEKRARRGSGEQYLFPTQSETTPLRSGFLKNRYTAKVTS